LAVLGLPTASPVRAHIVSNETTLPDDLLDEIRTGESAKSYASRSEHFHSVIGRLKRRNWTEDQIEALLAKYPNGVAEKYQGPTSACVDRH
jgi:hypothetical protein